MSDNAPIIGAGGGGGGKGGASRAPTSYAPAEIEDSLRSKSYVDVIYALGEGPIQEFIGGMGGIYVDGTPMLSADGQPNFPGGADAWFRFGHPNQDPIPHDSVAADESPAQFEVKQDAAWVQRVTDPEADSVVVTLGFPQMAYQDTRTGEVGGTSVSLQFFLRSNDGEYFAQQIGYGPVPGVKAGAVLTASSPATDATFRVRSAGSRYRKLKVYVGLSFGTRTLANANFELLEDGALGSAVGYGQVSYPAGGTFSVWIEPNDGLITAFTVEQYQFFGRSYVHTVDGKCLQRYQQQHRISLTGEPPWDIKVVRLTGDSTSSALANQTWVDSYRTETNTRLKYPYTALCGVRFPAEAFSAIPAVKFHIRALLSSVPSNYDPVNRTYTAMSPSQEWDGTWRFAWHSNPVWAVVDVVANRRYGLGDFDIPLNKWELYQVAKYCDGNIPNGRGGTMPRFRCDLSIDTREEAYNWIQTLCAIFRGMAYHIDGYFTATCDRPGDPEYLFNNLNVVGGEFNYPGSSSTARHTSAYVTWRDPDQLGEPAVAYVPDRALIARYGFNPLRVSAPWCRSEVYARQIGEWMLATEKAGKPVVFKPSSAEAAFLRPGMLIAIADENRTGTRIGGRIVSSTASSVELDQAVEIRSGTLYRIRLFNSLGAPVLRTVTSAPGYLSTLNFSPDIDAEPAPFAVWILEAIDVLESQLARIVDITEESGGIGTVTALAHDPSIYDHIERDVPLRERPTSVISARGQAAPTNLQIDEALYIAPDQSIRNRVSISWQAAPGALSYQVAWRYASKPWVTADSGDTLHEIPDAAPGAYVFRVWAKNVLGVRSRAAEVRRTIRGKTTPPPKVSVLRIVALRDGKRRAVFRYRAGLEPVDHRGYLIRYGRGVWSTWAGMTRLHSGVITTSPLDFNLYGQGLYTFAIKGVDTSGNESVHATFRQVTLPRASIDGDLIAAYSDRDERWPGEVSA